MSKTGTCKFFNDAKGFGFIVQDDGGEDLFAHRNELADGQDLVDGDRVFFNESYDDRKGKSFAQNITGGTGGESSGGGKGFGGGGKGFGGGGKGFGGGFGGYGGGDKGFGGGGKSKGKGKGKDNGPAVYVGGLSWDTTTDGMTNHFAGAGEIVYARVMTDRETGRSKGSGKIEFANHDGMNNAIAHFNGSQLDGRAITVRQFT